MDNINSYLLIDSGSTPNIWYYLTFKSLSFEPLYRYEYSKIKSIIPYVIQLNKTTHPKVVNDLLTYKDYQSGLVIQSKNTLVELADKLGYFYHVVNEKKEPYLRRFFDLKFFPRFIATLGGLHCSFLFENETAFYYLDSGKAFYHHVYLRNNQICFDEVDINEFKEKIG